MVFAIKKNMTQIYDEDGNKVPVTILDYSECGVKEMDEKSAYVYFGKTKKRKTIPKELVEIFTTQTVQKGNSENAKSIKESNGSSQNKRKDVFPLHYKFIINTEESKVDFNENDKVRVIGISKGKGFAGVMKRWNMKGGKRTHGASNKERAVGSIGAGGVGRVFPKKTMPGHKGAKSAMVRGVEILKKDEENKLYVVRGSVPGPANSVVMIDNYKF